MSEATETTERREMGTSDGMKWLSGIASLIGLWILVSPFIYGSTQAGLWNNVIIGAAIFLLAGYNYYRITTDHETSIAAMVLVALLGLWTLIVPFAFDIGVEALLWSNVGAGVLTAIFAGYVGYNRRQVAMGAPVTD